MIEIIITSIITLFPAIFPMMQVVRKQELNLFDFLLLFSTIYFSVIPLIFCYRLELYTEVDGVYNTTFYYMIYAICVLIVDILWRSRCERSQSIINITRFIQQYDSIEISIVGKIIIGVIFIYGLTYYMPLVTVLLQEEHGRREELLAHDVLVKMQMFTAVWTIMGNIILLTLAYSFKKGELNRVMIFYASLYVILMLFFPRREFLGVLMTFTICLYSVKRDWFSKKRILELIGFYSIILTFYFPFYNVMRNSPIVFIPSKPIESITEMVSYAVDNWDDRVQDENDASMTDNRSLGVYIAVYSLCNKEIEPYLGKIFMLEMDVSIPRFLNPNKESGAQEKLEMLTDANTDQADSYLLYMYADFLYIGAVATVLFYMLIFVLYDRLSYLIHYIVDSNIVLVIFAIKLFSLVWNIEGTIGGVISWLFSSLFIIVLVIIVEKMQIVTLKKTPDSCI